MTTSMPVGGYLGGPVEVAGREAMLGEPAPAFQMRDEEGKAVTLRRLSRRGPVVLHLYRGNW